MATSLREGHSRQSSHLSQGEREAHSHPASLLSERDGSLLLPHSRQSSILSALSDSFSSSYYSHSLSSHSRQTSLLSSHRSSPSSHSRVSSLLSDSTSPFPASSFYPSQAQSSPHGLPTYSASPSQPHRLQQNGNHCRQPSASSSHSRSSPLLSCNEDMLHACVFHQLHQSFQKTFCTFSFNVRESYDNPGYSYSPPLRPRHQGLPALSADPHGPGVGHHQGQALGHGPLPQLGPHSRQGSYDR